MKALKWVLLGVGGLALVAIALVVWFVATFDPNAYKPRIIALVKERTGRTLAIDGPLAVTIFPTLGASVPKVTVSDPNSPHIFAQAEEARVGVALLPLIAKTVKVDKVVLKGFTVDLVRSKDGHTNFDDLTGQSAKAGAPSAPSTQTAGGAPLAIDVGSIAIERSAIGWRDEQSGTNLRLTDLTLRTGRLANDVAGQLNFKAHVEGVQPKADLQVRVDTGYRLNFATKAVALSAFSANVAGDAAGYTGMDASLKSDTLDVESTAQRITVSKLDLAAKSKDGLDTKLSIPKVQLSPDHLESQAITGDLKLAAPDRTATAKLQVAPLAAQGKHVQSAGLTVEFTAKQGGLAVQGRIATPVTLDLDKRQADLPQITGELTATGNAVPNKSVKSTLSGHAHADWGAEDANVDLALQLDQSHIQTTLAVAHWAQPALTFRVVADRLNLDQYLAATKSGESPAGEKSAGQPERPFDLSPLKTLNATGDVKVGALQVANIKAEEVAVHLKAAGGRLDLDPISATLYQGTLAGNASANANDNHFTLKQRLAGVSVGPLLRDAAHKDLVDGRGTVGLDLTTIGNTVTALKKALAGTASVALRDGTLKGIDFAQTLHSAEAALGAKTALAQPAQGATTAFSELTATFVIKNGVAHNDDLQAKSPFVRLTGHGDINIAADTVDYTTNASVGGQGVTIPVRASGPLANLTYSVDTKALASEMVKGTVQQIIPKGLGGQPGSSQGGAAGSSGSVIHGLGGLFSKPK